MFFYTCNEKSKKEIEGKKSFTKVSRRTKDWGKNLTKEVHHLYTENYKILLAEISNSWLVKLNAVMMAVPPKAVCRFSTMPVKIPKEIVNPQIHMEYSWPWITKQSWKRKNTFGGLKIPNFKSYCEAMVTLTVWYWHKDRYIDQWNRIVFRSKAIHVWPVDSLWGC